MQSISLVIALAWRNLWRNPRRTLVILLAIVIGVWAMVVTSAFMRGISNQILEDTINNLTGHIQIHHQAYLDDPVIDHTINESQPSLLNYSKQIADITHIVKRIRVPAVITSERDSTGLVLVGIEPQKETGMSFIADSITQGRFLESASDAGIIIGKKLAERLETQLGRRVVVVTQNKHNEIADRGFRIVGIFDAQIEAMETGFVFIGLKTVQHLLDVEGEVTEFAIRITDPDNIEQRTKELQQYLPDLDIKSWMQIEPLSQIMIQLYDQYHLIWHLIVFIAMGFGIINTLLMAVFERTREFGLFQALGLKPRFILWQVWIESLMLLLLGLSIGNAVSWITVVLIGDGIDVSNFAQGMEMANLSSIIPFVITSKDLLLANSVVIILGMLTSLYPAWRASRLVPANAITRI